MIHSSPRDMDNERRSNERTSVCVELRLHAPSEHFVLLSRTVDLSSAGAFVRSNRPLPVGTEVTLQFDRGLDRNPLTIDAHVVRIGTLAEGRSRGIAVRFRNTSDLDQALIDDIIRRATH